MAMLWALLLASALRGLHAAQQCEGEVFLGNTAANFSEAWPLVTTPDDFSIRISVNVSDCGFTVIPQYHVFVEHLVFFDCSNVVNPTPRGFELICFIPFEPFSPDQLLAMGLNPSDGSRRLSSSAFTSDIMQVVRWTATPPALVDTAREAERNLSTCQATVDDLTEELGKCTTSTSTTTLITGTSTSVTQTTTTLDGATTTQTTTATTTTPVGATTTQTSATETSATRTTNTRTTTMTTTGTTAAVAPPVASSGIALDCDSLLPHLIASLVFNGICVIIIGALLFIRRAAAPKPVVCQAPATNTPNTPMRDWEFNVDVNCSPAVRQVVSSERALGASRGTDRSGEAAVKDMPSAGQRSNESWGGRSIIYKYLRFTPRSGNEVQATSARGWKMNAEEPPNMCGDQSEQSAAVSRGEATPARSSGIARSWGVRSSGKAGRSSSRSIPTAQVSIAVPQLDLAGAMRVDEPVAAPATTEV